MTMVIACQLEEGAAIFADSRVTWEDTGGKMTYGDCAQKIVSLGPNLTIAFAGSVKFANRIIDLTRASIRKKHSLRSPMNLSRKLSRIAVHYYKECLKNTNSISLSTSFILGAILNHGSPFLWKYNPPDFVPIPISGWDVIGSGSVIRPFLQNNFHAIIKRGNSLKDKATILMIECESELRKQNVITVGGLFQAILLHSGKIFPLTYGFADLTPEHLGRAKETEISKGVWTQKDLTSNRKLSLVPPHTLLRSQPIDNRFHDYEPPQKKELRWYLNHFFTCQKVETQPNAITCNGLISEIGLYNLPTVLPVFVSLDFWGAIGTYPLKFCLEHPCGEIVLLQKDINISFPNESVELNELLMLNLVDQGSVFLNCYINNFLLGRKPLYIRKLDGDPPSTVEEFSVNREKVESELISAHKECSDHMLNQKACFLEYFIICQKATFNERNCSFEGEMKAVYSKKYPLLLMIHIASGFRLAKGRHLARIDLINVLTHETFNITSVTCEGSSECLVVPIRGNLMIKIPKPGIYFFNLYVDDKFVSSVILPAENDEPKYSYSPLKEDMQHLHSGEVFILSKRSKQLEKQ